MSPRRFLWLPLVVTAFTLVHGTSRAADERIAVDELNALRLGVSTAPVAYLQPAVVEPPKNDASQNLEPEALPKPAGNKPPKFIVPSQAADPEPPRWGSLEQPIESLPPYPVHEYLLAGPDAPVFQQFEGHGYRRPVTDPASVAYDSLQFNRAIDLNRPDGFAPMGVVGDHTLNSGSRMLFSYRYSAAAYQGNQIGTQTVSDASVAAQFPFVPKNMLLERHLLLLEYAPVDNLTMLMQFPILQGTIRYQTAGGGIYQDDRTDVGDISTTALYVLRRWNHQQLHLNFGISWPTNLVQTLGNLLPDVNGQPRLSYPIRTGSGSVDLLPGLTYRGQTDVWTWGAQATVTARTGFNQYDYILGNQFELTPWLSGKLTEQWSLSSRLDWRYWGNIHGADPGLVATMSPTTNPSMQGGNRVDLLFGANYLIPKRCRPGWDQMFTNRLGVEAGFPIYQFLDGPQLQNQFVITTGWNLAW